MSESEVIAKATILIVEDEVELLEILVLNMEFAGYRAMTALNGVEGWYAYDRDRPDLILLDLNLPQMSGFRLLELIRAESDVPIIVFTAYDFALVEEIARYRPNVFFNKPFEMDHLLVWIERLLADSKAAHSRNSVTGLPDAQKVEEHLIELLFDQDWTVLHVAVNDFSLFTESHGTRAGDQVLQLVAEVLRRTILTVGSPSDFVGDLGTGDFVIVTLTKKAEKLSNELVKYFAEASHTIHPKQQNYEKGTLLPSLTMGLISSEAGPYTNAAEIIEAAIEAGRVSGYIITL